MQLQRHLLKENKYLLIFELCFCINENIMKSSLCKCYYLQQAIFFIPRLRCIYMVWTIAMEMHWEPNLRGNAQKLWVQDFKLHFTKKKSSKMFKHHFSEFFKTSDTTVNSVLIMSLSIFLVYMNYPVEGLSNFLWCCFPWTRLLLQLSSKILI